MSGITHRLVGYDRATERVADEHTVPDDILPKAKVIAHVPEDDPDAAMCYRLSEQEARDLAGFLKTPIDSRHDYYLEGFAAE